MTALPEYKTRRLLANLGIPLVDGVFLDTQNDPGRDLLPPPVYLKAQITGATSRAAQGLVRRVDDPLQVASGIEEMFAAKTQGPIEGVLVTSAANICHEYYVGCILDFGSANKLPGGILMFSSQGGSGVEARSGSLKKIPFSLLRPPTADMLTGHFAEMDHPEALATFLEGIINTFIRYKLTVLEVNPVGVREDGSLLVIDCRAEFERHAIAKTDKPLFTIHDSGREEQTRIERIVEKINALEPAGTGFIRENREPIPAGAYRVATNLCGGGGKMLWEMAVGGRKDIYSVNESDTSGGLSAFKSYRLLRAILALDTPQVLLLTGSGMAFQNQYHLAAAVWKALRESPTPLPSLLRFGGTEEDKAQALMERVVPSLPVKVRTFPAHLFPSAMIDHIAQMASEKRMTVVPEDQPGGEPSFRVDLPPGEFYFDPQKWTQPTPPPCVTICPTQFLKWNPDRRWVEPAQDARCIGCLLCETVSLLEGNGELRIKLDIPEMN